MGADSGIALRPLAEDHLGAVQSLMERCADYFRLAEGREPRRGEARDLRAALPEGVGYDRKQVLGVFAGDELVGVVDLIGDWPRPGTWLIGLLLLDPAVRGRGAGSAVAEALDALAAEHGADRLRVAVVPANESALRFWRRLGFTEVEPTRPSAIALERATGAQPSAPGAARWATRPRAPSPGGRSDRRT